MGRAAGVVARRGRRPWGSGGACAPARPHRVRPRRRLNPESRMIRVLPLTAARERDWTAFLLRRPDGLLYHSLAYRDMLVALLGCEPEYLIAVDDDDAVRGVLPIMWASGGRVANALPYYGSIGAPVADSADAAHALEKAWNERATAD